MPVLFLGVILFAVVMLIMGPIFTIWSLNLLFGLAIPVTFWTWLSMFWLCMVVGGAFKASASNKS